MVTTTHSKLMRCNYLIHSVWCVLLVFAVTVNAQQPNKLLIKSLKEVKELRVELQQMDTQNEALKRQLEELHIRATAPQEQLQELREQNAELRQRTAQLNAQNETLQQQLEELHIQATAPQEQLQELREQNAELRQRTEQLNAQNETLQQQLEELHIQATAPQEQLQELREQNAELRQRTEQLNTQNETLQQQQQELRKQNDLLRQPKDDKLPPPKQAKPKPPPAKPKVEIPQLRGDAPLKETAAYNRAVQSLDKKPGVVRKTLLEFLAEYGDGYYSGEINYWLAESYYETEEYAEAKQYYERVVKKFPQSKKFNNARLKLAYTYYEIEQWDNARVILKSLKKLDNAHLSGLAKKRLQRMKREGH